MKRERIDSVDRNLVEDIERLRREARGTPPGVHRDRLLRQVKQAEAILRMRRWATSPALQSPK